MPWIELHHNLREHPKTARLVEVMGFADADHAVGKLSRLWLWALEYAPEGYLDQLNETQLAVASGVDPKDAAKWMALLVDARWLDSQPRLRIHNWWKYVGYYLKKRWDKTPERWKEVEKAYAAEPQRNRGGPPAATHTGTNQTKVQPTNAGARESHELPSKQTAVDMSATTGAAPDFAAYVYDDWFGRGGCDAAGIEREWLQYVKTRWERERKQWMDGTHKGKQHGSSTNRKDNTPDRNAGFFERDGATGGKAERNLERQRKTGLAATAKQAAVNAMAKEVGRS